MNWQYSLLSIPLFIASGISLVVAYVAWQRRESPGARALLYLMAAIALWTLTSGMEKLVYEISEKIFWSKIQYFGIASTPLFFMLFAFRYSQQDHWLTRPNLILLWIIPVTTIIMAVTNEHHLLLWNDFSLNPENTNLLIYHYGPWFWFIVAYGYLCVIVALGVLIWLIPRFDISQRRQIIGMILAGMIPWIGNIIYLLGWIPVPGFDVTPFSFAISELVLAMSMFSFQLFNLTPIARSRLVDTMQDVVIVIDQNCKIADINPAALILLNKAGEEVKGELAQDTLSIWPRLAHSFKEDFQSPTVQRVIQDINNRWYDCRISPLRDKSNQTTGWLVVLRDITSQRQAETEIRRLATVIEQATETIVITDLQGNITYVNPYFETSTGYSVEEALGANPNILKSGIQDESFYKNLWTTISNGETWEGNFINRRKDGSFYHEAATIFPIKNREGELTSYAAVKRDITDQVKAEDEIQKFSDQLAVLHQIGILLSLTETSDEICRLAIELGRDELGFDRLGLWIVDQKNSDYLKGTYGIDESGKLRSETEQRLYIPSDKMYGLLTYGKSRVFYHESFEIRNDRGETVGSGEVAATGLWVGNKMIGYLITDNLLSKEKIHQRFVNVLSLYGQTLTNLLSRKQIEQEIRMHAQQQELLNEITQIAIGHDKIDDMFQFLADRLGELLEADGCYITSWDEDEQKTTPVTAYGPFQDTYKSIADPQPGEPTLTETVLKSGEVLIVENVHDTPFLSKRLATKFPAISNIVLPLIANQQKFGAALIAFDKPRNFTQEEIKLSQQAAHQISLAILKAKLFTEAEARAKEAEDLREESEIIRKASAAIVSTLNQDEVIELILEQLNEVVEYDSASVLLNREDEMEIVGGRGFPNSKEIIGIRFPLIGTPNAIVLEQKGPYILDNAPEVFEAFRHHPHFPIKSWMGIPIIVKDEIIGMLALDSHTDGRFDIKDARLASIFADQVAIALENARLFEETQRLAIRDSLTNLYNRRYFMELAAKQFEYARRYQHPFSVIMMDIDNFKKVNDTFGHMIGDQVLQTVAKLCQTSLRSSDLIGRYGGEEFVITLPETPIQKPSQVTNKGKPSPPFVEPGISVADRLRKRIEQEIFHFEKSDLSLTISLGIAEMDPSCPTVEKLIDNADLALLKAKQRGRNQVVTWIFEESPNQS
jgi:PAS domain S-box-containing protein